MKCFYHKSDLDGHCSGAIIKFAHPDCQMIGIDYGDSFPWEIIKENELVFMVDFSLPPKDMFNLAGICSLSWIDHHKTTIDSMSKFISDHPPGSFPIIFGNQEVGRAGCELTWTYMFPDKRMPFGVKLLGRYDIWDHSDPRVLPYQYRMRMENLDPANWTECGWYWRNIFNELTNDVDLVGEGRLLLRYEEQQNARFCKFAAFDTILTADYPDKNERCFYVAIAANRGFTNSKLFDSVYDPNRHELMISFIRLHGKDRKWKVSLYSTQDHINCGEIAKSFGGGGHKGAAGFHCDELPFEV